MKFYYDLHIHTALSPCCEDDATPHNIVGMATLAGLDIIAVTDHNSAGNTEAVIAVAKSENPKLLVVAGIELTTSEEIHILLLFPSVQAAKEAQEEIERRKFKIKNKPDIFGRQLYMDSCDQVVAEEETLLITATEISADEAVTFAKKYGAVAVPAHIDKPANAMIAILGEVPEEAGFTTIELTTRAPMELREQFMQKGYHILTDSDSHMLGVMNETTEQNAIELPKLSADALIRALSQKMYP